MLKKIKSLLLFYLLIPSLAYAEYEVSNTSIPYSLSKAYCVITHPAEWYGTVLRAEDNPDIRRNATCEKQHIVQQQAGGGNEKNTVFWAESYHTRTDRWRDTPWATKQPFWEDAGFITKDSSRALFESYMLGTWGLSYSIFKHDYSGAESTLIIFDNDGASNSLYSFSYIVNLPQKYINQWVYVLDKQRYSLIIDLIIAIPVLIFEASLAVLFGFFGMIVGTVFNPIDTIMAIPGAIVYALDSLITAIWNTGLGIFRLVVHIIASLFNISW